MATRTPAATGRPAAMGWLSGVNRIFSSTARLRRTGPVRSITRTPIRYGRQVAAVIDEDSVNLLSPIDVLEQDHPRRRFVGMMALIGRQMQLGPDGETYDDALAAFYARAMLIPAEKFVPLDDGRPDAQLAEHFNVPLEQIAAKRHDLEVLIAHGRPVA